VWNRTTGVSGQVTRVSVGSQGEGFGPSTSPAISADGRFVAFDSDADELIPDDDILASQFADVLTEQDTARTRLAELQALFTAADDEDFDDADDSGVMNSEQVKDLKARLKDAKGQAAGQAADAATGSKSPWWMFWKRWTR